ncbi:MAG TPA: adenylyl-sulfate kinase [Thermoplasmata archaeon]|nr:adenylyl-sulfate kinase [Thermoplasmata archaeon]
MGGSPAPGKDGFVVWIEGLPGSGKSTTSKRLAASLGRLGRANEVLDGEEVRRTFFPELGFSRKDRETHARRVSALADRFAGHGTAVIVAMITPYETSRQAARAVVRHPFVEVWLRCPMDVCRQRDPRGVYSNAPGHAVGRVTGVDDPFEEPLGPDLIVDTARDPVETTAGRIIDHLAALGLVPAV